MAGERGVFQRLGVLYARGQQLSFVPEMSSVTGARACNTLKGSLRRMRRAVRSLITPQGADTHSISFMFECEEAPCMRGSILTATERNPSCSQWWSMMFHAHTQPLLTQRFLTRDAFTRVRARNALKHTLTGLTAYKSSWRLQTARCSHSAHERAQQTCREQVRLITAQCS